MQIDRRSMLALSLGALAAPAFAQAPGADVPPIIFVHGNGDHSALWQTLLWRFESNGYPRDLIAFDFTDPLVRDDDATPQANRSSAEDQRRELAAQVDRVLAATGAPRVALVGSSRGGNAIRNFVTGEGAASKVSHAVLCGTPNHGVFNFDRLPGSEFNGRGPVLSRLNAQPGEITTGPAWLTLRSDGFDKFAQPDGRFVGMPGVPTNIGYDGPELKGATNLVLGMLDHREVAFHPRAFREIYKFIAGGEPATIAVVPQPNVEISGKVTATPGSVATNRPVAGALVQVFAVSSDTGARVGAPLYENKTDASGMWGPAKPPAGAPLEFVVTADGYPVTHIYRNACPRSTRYMNLRPARALTDAEKSIGAVTLFTRPRGYFGLPRDVVLFDGKEPTDVKAGVPADATTTLRLPEFSDRPIIGQFNEERVVCRAWPARDNHITIAELTY